MRPAPFSTRGSAPQETQPMRTLLLTALALAASACTQTGRVTTQLTDAPVDTGSIKQVLITVGEVRIHDDEDTSTPSNGDPAAGADKDGADGKGWIVLCNTAQQFDLLTLRNGVKAD